MARIRREAPGVMMDWATEGPQTLLAEAEGQVDVAFVASALALPEGLGRHEAGDVQWTTFARRDHPAIGSWGAAAWAKWPHVVVQVGNSLQSPVTAAAGEAARKRPIAARVLNFSAVGPLLARTDLLATLPVIVMHEDLEQHGLTALPPPFPVKAMPHRFVWSQRLSNDPAARWLRAVVAECFAEVLQDCEARILSQLSTRTRRTNRGGPAKR
jgi:DNA-binding transcriptional LysR family regulator